ncbi:MAG: hypothetical protein WC001_10130 [Desulfurivibrionaceae bacterium]
MKETRKSYVLAAVLLLTIGLGGCGSGGGTSFSDGSGSSPDSVATLQGAAVKGPVSGATVTAFAIENGAMGAQLGSATTDAQGNFTMPLSDYTGPVLLQMSGGSYTDEATGQLVSMAEGEVMTAVMPSLPSTGTIANTNITPLTSMAQAMAQNMPGGMTVANITVANGAITHYFLVGDILTTPPMNPLIFGAGTGASPESRNYGLALAAMSQYAKEMGLPSSAGIVTAMMNDAADGTMDGMLGNRGIEMRGGGTTMSNAAARSGLADAMTNFAQSPMNRSGVAVAEMQTLMSQLRTSTGQLAANAETPAGNAFSGNAGQEAMVTAYALMNGGIGGQLASGMTDAEGNFTLPLGAYTGPVMFRVNEGASTGTPMTAVMSSLASNTPATGLEITPYTSMAQNQAQNMPGGLTAANISAANTAMGNRFK